MVCRAPEDPSRRWGDTSVATLNSGVEEEVTVSRAPEDPSHQHGDTSVATLKFTTELCTHQLLSEPSVPEACNLAGAPYKLVPVGSRAFCARPLSALEYDSSSFTTETRGTPPLPRAGESSGPVSIWRRKTFSRQVSQQIHGRMDRAGSPPAVKWPSNFHDQASARDAFLGRSRNSRLRCNFTKACAAAALHMGTRKRCQVLRNILDDRRPQICISRPLGQNVDGEGGYKHPAPHPACLCPFSHGLPLAVHRKPVTDTIRLTRDPAMALLPFWLKGWSPLRR